MFRNLFLFFAIAAFAGITLPGFAQQDTLYAEKLILKFSPQHLFVGGYHFSLEKRLPHKPNQGLVIAPHFYHGDTRFLNQWSDRYKDGDDKGRVTGYGAEVQHRLYFQKGAEKVTSMQYVAYSLSYSSFNIDFERGDWVQEMENNGLEYYRFRDLPFTEKIKRLGAAALIGMQGPFLSDRLIADMYAGIGYRHTISSSNHSTLWYDKSFFDFGYKGLQPLLGVNFGYAF